MSATRLRPCSLASGAPFYTTLSPGRRYRLARDAEHVCHSKTIPFERRVDRESPTINQSRVILYLANPLVALPPITSRTS